MERIYAAGWQGRKVRFVAWVVLGALALALWGGWEITRGYGLRPADGGVLKPLAVRLAFGGCVAALGLLFAVGMWIYGRCYVAEASVDETRGVLGITLIGLVLRSRMEVPVDDVEGSTYHAGRSNTGDFTVNAPWVSVRLRGRRLPLIVDAQGEFIRRELVVEHLFRAPRRGRRGTARPR
ncbi:hypothetical protein [Longimicrobium sp.]|uniref:hypothetical protein n=1 Tax=Longimicrobium sp. TaxID=2029185 RepID=UPI002E3687A0|nr:hypothetical protein [Longimicrobium sp.]HEX6038402.1 hypothetical protein [Longimicrobium sp.]